jgi:hypothetical protein
MRLRVQNKPQTIHGVLPSACQRAGLLFLGLILCFSNNSNAQSPTSFEVCGVPFRLGMTRDEVKSKIVRTFPPDFGQVVFGGDRIELSPTMFGLPSSSECYGTLRLKDDRVIEIQRTLTSTTNAVTLLRNLYLQLRDMVESSDGQVNVKTWTRENKDKDSRLFLQTIRFDFGNSLIELQSEEGNIAEHNVGPITTISVGIKQRQSPR